MLIETLQTLEARRERTARRDIAKGVYRALMRECGPVPGGIDELARSASHTYLMERLQEAADLQADLPDRLHALPAWLAQGHDEVARQYRQYLDKRRSGAPRRFFTTRSHALHFLRAVAPTKLVDGAWLYGLLPHADEPGMAGLVRIYLDELGRGMPGQNHVVLYRELLARHGLDDSGTGLSDDHFTQGAIQLALAHHAEEFLPEVIGFNLGYEQLPLHLPITAYELAELDIDPYYFTLHVTVDNASSGHARQALDALFACQPRLGNERRFYERVAAGYKLNLLGTGTVDAIAAFDLDREVVAMLADKARVGAALHSDHCRVGGRTVTEWLNEPARMPEFLRAMEGLGWIRRGQAPEQSRFWRLLHDPGAPMFGVFSAWEETLLADWIATPSEPSAGTPAGPALATARRPRPRVDPHAAEAATPPLPHDATTAQVVRHHLRDIDPGSEFDADVRVLADDLAGLPNRREAMALLTGLLSPANHPTKAGLLATRLYGDLLDRRG
jgi:hypothetical protein